MENPLAYSIHVLLSMMFPKWRKIPSEKGNSPSFTKPTAAAVSESTSAISRTLIPTTSHSTFATLDSVENGEMLIMSLWAIFAAFLFVMVLLVGTYAWIAWRLRQQIQQQHPTIPSDPIFTLTVDASPLTRMHCQKPYVISNSNNWHQASCNLNRDKYYNRSNNGVLFQPSQPAVTDLFELLPFRKIQSTSVFTLHFSRIRYFEIYFQKS